MLNIILCLVAFSVLTKYESEPVSAKVYRTVETQTVTHRGLASYYSRSGCLGCSDTLTMANGEPLDDSKLTLAFMRAPLNTMVTVTNVKTRQSVVAKVSDRGGFEHLKVPKIADLSVATKEAIGCGDICEVEIEL